MHPLPHLDLPEPLLDLRSCRALFHQVPVSHSVDPFPLSEGHFPMAPSCTARLSRPVRGHGQEAEVETARSAGKPVLDRRGQRWTRQTFPLAVAGLICLPAVMMVPFFVDRKVIR